MGLQGITDQVINVLRKPFLKITCDFPAVIYMQIFLNLLFTLYALKLGPESCNSWPSKRRVSQAPLYTVPIWCSVFWSAEIIAGNTCALSRYYSNCSRITTRYRNGIPFINSPPDVFTAMYFITFIEKKSQMLGDTFVFFYSFTCNICS